MLKFYLSSLFLFFVQALFAQTTTDLVPVADNNIFFDVQGYSNAKGDNFSVGNTAGSSPRRGLIKFNLASLGTGAIITSATLKLYCNRSPNSFSSSTALKKLTANWGEGTSNANGQSPNDGYGIDATPGDATWLNTFFPAATWANPGGDFNSTSSATTPVTTSGVTYSWSSPQLIADVQSWVNSPAANFGWIIIGDETVGQSAKRFHSRENPDLAHRPVLTVTYTIAAPCTTNTWTGAVNSAWETTGNWSCNAVPDATTDVIINNGTVILNSNGICKSISIQPGVVFTVNTGFNLKVIH
jgi:hypothetical protein